MTYKCSKCGEESDEQGICCDVEMEEQKEETEE